MRAVAARGRQAPRVMRRLGIEVTNPQVKIMHRLPTFHDPNAMTDRDVMERTGLTSASEATREVFGPAATIVGGQSETRSHVIGAVLLATLGR